MGFFSKLFGGEGSRRKRKSRSVPAAPVVASQLPGATAVAKKKEFRVFDKYGREVLISEHDWRTQVLPSSLKAAWNDPEQLAGLITTSLDDQFYPDVLDAAA